MDNSKIVLCTGANQGLGYAVLQVAALRQPAYTYVLASRDPGKSKAAAKSLRAAGVLAPMDVIQLDIENDGEITLAAAYVENTYGKLDVLTNNAGIIRRPPSGDLSALRTALEEVRSTNLTSVAVVTEAFMPLLRKSAGPRLSMYLLDSAASKIH